MKTFIDEEFMLHSEAARRLYHDYAEGVPIFDFHCHLEPKEIAENKRFSNLTELWLGGDHYKWRLMRAYGVDERYITGDAPPYEKFLKWAETLAASVGNPLYHWTHLELKRCFHIDTLLTPATAPEIWAECNRQLSLPEFAARGIIESFGVKALATTDDPASDLCYHRALVRDTSFKTLVLPTFRPDKALHVENAGFGEYVATLGKACGMVIDSVETLLEALKQRAEYFCAMGCKSADHSFAAPDFQAYDEAAAQSAFAAALAGNTPTAHETNAYHTVLMTALGRLYHRLGMVMQLHLGVVRNNSTRRMASLGADSGFDAIGDTLSASSLQSLLNRLDTTNELPQTVLYTLNDSDNAKFAVMAGCFQSGGVKSKVQLGSAWWFHDHRDGMVTQLRTLANVGLLSGSIGMLTDSRSFLSYTRHEYFRRILCNLLGGWMEDNEAPKDFEQMGRMVQDICFSNAAGYFHVNMLE